MILYILSFFFSPENCRCVIILPSKYWPSVCGILGHFFLTSTKCLFYFYDFIWFICYPMCKWTRKSLLVISIMLKRFNLWLLELLFILRPLVWSLCYCMSCQVILYIYISLCLYIMHYSFVQWSSHRGQYRNHISIYMCTYCLFLSTWMLSIWPRPILACIPYISS